jgi:hypothetical protein
VKSIVSWAPLFLLACGSNSPALLAPDAAAGAGGSVAASGGVAGSAGAPAGEGGVTAAGAGGSGGAETPALTISRAEYAERLYGFWLAQCIANWTGLITEFDKDGVIDKAFYTDASWGTADEPTVWNGQSGRATIDFVFVDPGATWKADDDTDLEYMYQFLVDQHGTAKLSGAQIRDGWLAHIYAESEATPFGVVSDKGSLAAWQQNNGQTYYENKLWVSNQTAYNLMVGVDQNGNAIDPLEPPATGDASNNPNYDMIDAQLTTEIFGFYAPGRPEVALDFADLPIRTTAREDAQRAAEFYVVMYSLASTVDPALSMKDKVFWLADQARARLTPGSYSAAMYDTVKALYQAQPLQEDWEAARDAIYSQYQLGGLAGYDYQQPFDSGINFASSLVSLFYGEGDLRRTIQIASLTGWDSDNPTATWGGLLGFLLGRQGVEAAFGRTFSDAFDIHSTRKGFPNDGQDTFGNMAARGVAIVDRAVIDQLGGAVDLERDVWLIP